MIHFLKFLVLRDPSFYIFEIDSKINYSSYLYLSTKNNYFIKITLVFEFLILLWFNFMLHNYIFKTNIATRTKQRQFI